MNSKERWCHISEFRFVYAALEQQGYSWVLFDFKTGKIFQKVDFRKGSDFSMMQRKMLDMAIMYDSFRAAGLEEYQFYPAFIEASKEFNNDVIVDVITIEEPAFAF